MGFRAKEAYTYKINGPVQPQSEDVVDVGS